MSTYLDAPFTDIARGPGGPCVSLLFPVDLRHPDRARDELLVRRLAGEATVRLGVLGLPDVLGVIDVDDLHARAAAVGAGGVAVYRAEGWGAEAFVPHAVGPVVAVDGCCHVLPLVPSLSERWAGHVLTVGAAGVALFRWADGRLERLAVPGLPADVDDSLWYERREHHAGAHAGGPGGRGASAIVHHGTGEADDRKRRLERHLHKVDDVVLDALGRDGSLVVVGTSASVAVYQRLTHHPWTIGLALGSPAELTEDELRLGVAEVARATRANAADRAVARYASLAGTGRATADGDELAAAAAAGRIDTLLVGSALTVPADDGIRLAWEHAADVAANQVVVEACRHGASVVHVDQARQPAMPELAGILRY